MQVAFPGNNDASQCPKVAPEVATSYPVRSRLRHGCLKAYSRVYNRMVNEAQNGVHRVGVNAKPWTVHLSHGHLLLDTVSATVHQLFKVTPLHFI